MTATTLEHSGSAPLPDNFETTASNEPLGPELSALESTFNGTDDMPDAKRLRARKLGKKLALRAGVEFVGAGVDAVLMGAGKAGVDVMRGVVTREITATAPEIAFLDRVLHRSHNPETSKEPPSRLRKLGGKAVSLALGIGTAVAAQKLGPGVANHIHSSLNHGIGEFAVPITSKIGALSGLSAVRGRIRPRFSR